MSEDSISQMQMLYVPEEDRILFRVNSADSKQFRLWLTRRFTLLFLKVLKNHVAADPDVSLQATPEAKAAMASFKQEQAMQGANFQQQFKEEAAELPLGEETPLAYRLNYRIEGETLHLGLEPKSGQGINLAINREVNASLGQLIRTAANKAEWQLHEDAADSMTGARVLN